MFRGLQTIAKFACVYVIQQRGIPHPRQGGVLVNVLNIDEICMVCFNKIDSTVGFL